jgi:ABC-type transport system substrate-binding protein
VLTDPKFRQALNWAVDRQRISDIAYNGSRRRRRA